jgi:hypothetical protein
MALTECMMLTALLLQRFEFTHVPGQSYAHRAAIIMALKDGLKVTVRPRTSGPTPDALRADTPSSAAPGGPSAAAAAAAAAGVSPNTVRNEALNSVFTFNG